MDIGGDEKPNGKNDRVRVEDDEGTAKLKVLGIVKRCTPNALVINQDII